MSKVNWLYSISVNNCLVGLWCVVLSVRPREDASFDQDETATQSETSSCRWKSILLKHELSCARVADGANILTVTRSKTLDVCRPDGSWADFNITYHIEYYCSGILIYKELKCLCETAVELLEFHQMQQMKLVLLLDQKMLISVSKSPRRRPQTS